MSKKPSYFNQNLPQLMALCRREGYEIVEIDEGSQYRVYAATHIIDIWPSRMVYHRVSGETIRSNEPYSHQLQQEFNENEVAHLLATGEYVKLQ